MTRPRATTSPSDALGATIADLKARLARLENIAHQHNTPASDFVRRAGDTMTGDLRIEASNPEGLYVGSDSDQVTDTKSIKVQSRGYAGILLDGDTDNVAGEPGGAFVRLQQDGGLVSGRIAVVQGANEDGEGGTYTGSQGNALLVGGNANLNLGAASQVRIRIGSTGIFFDDPLNMGGNNITNVGVHPGWNLLASGSGSGGISITVPSYAQGWFVFQLRVAGFSSSTAQQFLRWNGQGGSQSFVGGTMLSLQGNGTVVAVVDFSSFTTYRFAEWATVGSNDAVVDMHRIGSTMAVQGSSTRHSNTASVNRRFISNGRAGLNTSSFTSLQLSAVAGTPTWQNYQLYGFNPNP